MTCKNIKKENNYITL